MSDNEVLGTEAAAPATAETTAKPVRKSNKVGLIVSIVVVLLAVAAGVWYYMAPEQFSAPAKRIGAIDQEVIFGLDEFKKAEEEIKAFSDAKQKEFEAAVKAKSGQQGSEAELQNLYRKIDLEVSQKRNTILLPLQNRASAACASVARNKGLTVVLDKRIVVYGIPDITEDVKKVFQQPGDLELPAEVSTDNSPVAYFDQEVVRSLKVFSEAELKLFQYRNELGREFEKKAPSLSASEQELLKREMAARFDALSEQIMTPLNQKVITAVNSVAENQKISLVLDKQNVMYGGRNITDSVVETFLSSVGTPNGAPASAEAKAQPQASASAAAPAPAAAPEQAPAK